MKIAIIQPYVFPYIGYFQLINAVDKLVFYDDVNFIKQGWINRNRILLHDQPYLFSIPCTNISQNKIILDTKVHQNKKWVLKFFKTLEMSYLKAPRFDEVYNLVRTVLGSDIQSISELAQLSILEVLKYLDMKTIWSKSSECYNNRHLKKSERLINICKQERAQEYINPIGGVEIYTKEEFLKHGITLHFIKSKAVEYKQFSDSFVPWLSILDVLMFNSVEQVQTLLNQYDLI